MELYLIRHPRPAVAPGICYGQTDLGLAESASAVAERLRPLLPQDFALYASPLARARLLAEALGTPQLDPRLKEIHFGDWEGRSFDDIGQAALDAWAAEPLDFAPPGGESPRSMAQAFATSSPARHSHRLPVKRRPRRSSWWPTAAPSAHWPASF